MMLRVIENERLNINSFILIIIMIMNGTRVKRKKDDNATTAP